MGLVSTVSSPSGRGVWSAAQAEIVVHLTLQESSAKLTNQRVSYAFTSSPLSFHARHILLSSKFQHSYSCILLIFYTDISNTNSMCENYECEYSSLVLRFLFGNTNE